MFIPKVWRKLAVCRHAPDLLKKSPLQPLWCADLLWRNGGGEIFLYTCPQEVSVKIFVGVFTALSSPKPDISTAE